MLEVVIALPESRQPEGRSGDLHQTESQAGGEQLGGDPSCAPLRQQLEAGVAGIARHTAALLTDWVPYEGNRVRE